MNRRAGAKPSTCGAIDVMRTALLAGALAVGLHAAVLLRAWPDPQRFLSPPDSLEYVTIAANLRAGHGFSQSTGPPFAPDFLRTPVYPALLTVVTGPEGTSLRAAALLNSVIGLLTMLAAWAWVRRRVGSTPAMVTGLLLATDLTSLTYHHLVLTETTFAALLLAALWFLTDPAAPSIRSAAGTGASVGLAALCRPIAVLLTPALLPAFAARVRREGWRSVRRRYLTANAVGGLLIGLWVLRNLRDVRRGAAHLRERGESVPPQSGVRRGAP